MSDRAGIIMIENLDDLINVSRKIINNTRYETIATNEQYPIIYDINTAYAFITIIDVAKKRHIEKIEKMFNNIGMAETIKKVSSIYWKLGKST